MSNYDFEEKVVTFIKEEDVESYIETMVQLRTSKFIANFCVTIMFSVCFLVGFLSVNLINNINQQQSITTKQPN